MQMATRPSYISGWPPVPHPFCLPEAPSHTALADADTHSRIPHGFHEHEMAAYFAQFGAIKRLRLARNKKTGHSKHYAFVEFAEPAVARIVAQTMDHYLMFGHILRCKLVPPAQVHQDLWRGAGRRYKVMPRNRMEGSALKKGRGREDWEKKVKQERVRRLKKGERLKELGIEYEFEGPKLVGVEEVKRIEEEKVEEGADTENTAEKAVVEVAATM